MLISNLLHAERLQQRQCWRMAFLLQALERLARKSQEQEGFPSIMTPRFGFRSEPMPPVLQCAALSTWNRIHMLQVRRLEHCSRNQKRKGLLQSNKSKSWYLKHANSSLVWTSFLTNLNDCILLAFDARKKETVSLNRGENDRGEVIWLVCKMSGN